MPRARSRGTRRGSRAARPDNEAGGTAPSPTGIRPAASSHAGSTGPPVERRAVGGQPQDLPPRGVQEREVPPARFGGEERAIRRPRQALEELPRSGDLAEPAPGRVEHEQLALRDAPEELGASAAFGDGEQGDRKSTRLNSSHITISYAVFC